MGKSSSSSSSSCSRKLQQLARFINDNNNSKPLRPAARSKPVPKDQLRPNMEAAAESSGRRRLSDVVSECVNRWFNDTLKEAKGGDAAMQVLVGQMYCSGYGVVRDAQKGRAWIRRASKSRSSVWKVGDKHPGYNASDSDSDDVKEDAK